MAARRKNAAQANGPHSAPHTAASPPPAPSAGPPADGPAAAVWAALTATPGATAAQIATAAGTSRIVAGQELAALETSGLATRTPGARNGRTTAPATWQPAPQPATHRHPPPPPQARTRQARPGQRTPTAAPARQTATGSPRTQHRPGTGRGRRQPARRSHRRQHRRRRRARMRPPLPRGRGTPGEAAAPDAGTPDGSAADGPAAGENAAPAPADGEPQPAPASEAAVLLRELASAATQAADVLDGGDTAAALAVMDAICATAAQSRRLLKAAASGRKPRGTASPAARPGQLRDLVAAHLAGTRTPTSPRTQIGRVLGRSSGAVANALDRLTALGQAQLTSDKPRRYRHQAPASTPAPAGTT